MIFKKSDLRVLSYRDAFVSSTMESELTVFVETS